MAAQTPFTVNLPVELARRLDEAARLARKQPAVLAEEAIQQYLDVCDWQDANVRRGLEAADRGDFVSDEGLKRLLARLDIEA